MSVAPSVHTPSLPLGVILPPNQTTGLTLLFSHLSRRHPFTNTLTTESHVTGLDIYELRLGEEPSIEAGVC